MKEVWLAGITLVLIWIIVGAILLFPANPSESVSKRADFFFGVTFGSNSLPDAKILVDKVKDYTNLFVVDSYDISLSETALTDVCEYAVTTNLNIIPFFSFLLYNVTSNVGSFYNASTWDEYGVQPFHVSWLNNARARWGSNFLGVYYLDEPGGNQVDLGYWGGNNASRSGARIRTFDNVTDYADAARRYVSGLNRTRSMQILTNTSYPDGVTQVMPVFTSDYALYWFDYKAGYDGLFAQINATADYARKVEQIALCRGAASAQNKSWGVILTWALDSPPYLPSGANILADMKMAYNAGAKYVIVFNYPLINEFGALTEEHFSAMKDFWSFVQSNPARTDPEAQAAFVLPADYGWGMRRLEEKMWGLFPADNESVAIWDKINVLVDRYGLKLDIVYDDPQFPVIGKYTSVYWWNNTID
jgi:hypothetical protein